MGRIYYIGHIIKIKERVLVLLVQKLAIKKFLKDCPEELFIEPVKVKFEDDEVVYGKGDPKLTISINGKINKKEFIKNPSLALGEAYMDKIIDTDGDLFKIFDTVMAIRRDFLLKDGLAREKNDVSKRKQKEEVASHYDIGNNFYKLWLDETMNYSCAYFKEPDNTLYEAQCNKVNYIINKLQIEDGMSLLDIGCGWGDLLITAAKRYKITGLGITLSEEQHKAFKERIKEEGLEEYIDVKLMDYRDLEDSGLLFDRIVSVGMIEHVGNENYDLFLNNAKSVLKDEGLFLLHSITGLKEGGVDEWINKYIFPGGVLPSLREIIYKGVEQDFRILDVESLRRHYVMV